MNISHRNINFSAIGILAYALFFATGNSGAGLLNDPPMWESGPADTPVDTRIYIVDNYRKTIAVNGWEKAQPVPEGLQNAKSIASKAFKESGPVPDLAAASTADEQRAVIFIEMLQSFTKDGIDLEQRLNRIDSVLESKGSRIHKTGELGKLWPTLRNGGNREDDIRRPPPKYA